MVFELNGEFGRRLRIVVQGYEREESNDPDDASWLKCDVQVELGAFRGAVDASFQASDFLDLLSDMKQIMSGSVGAASFRTMEEALAFRVEVSRTGGAVVTGKVREAGEFGAEISFAFQSDRSFLTKSHSDLERIVAAYPGRPARG